VPPPQPTVDAQHVVIVPIGDLDRRAVLALDRAARVSHASIRALHLCADSDAAHAFALRWASADRACFGVPLDIVESPLDRWDDRLRAILDVHSRESPGRVTVVIGRLRLRRRWHRLLHDHSSERIRQALDGMRNVHIEFVDLPV
jgi:hypothetical protein